MNLKFTYLILLVLSGSVLYGQTDPILKLWKLGLQNNPRIFAQSQKVKAIRKMVTPMSFPSDPMLKFNYMNQPVESGVKSPMSSFQILLSQNIPFPTKLYLKGAIQYLIFEMEEANLRMLISTVKKDIKLKYIKIVMLKHTLTVEQEKLSKIQLINSIAQTKYQLGKGLQQDLLKISITQLHAQKKIILINSMLASTKYELSYLLGNKAIPSDLVWKDPLIQNFDKQLLKNVIKNFPLLAMKEKAVEKTKAKLSLARWDYLPNLGLNLGYNIRDNSLPDGGVDQFTVGVSASVPLYSFFKQIPLNQSRKFSLKSAQEDLQDALNNVEQMWNTHLEMYTQNKEIVALYEQKILGESVQALDSSLTSYQVDKVDFLNVLNSLISLYQQQDEYYEVKANLEEHQTWLEYLLNSQKDIGVGNE